MFLVLIFSLFFSWSQLYGISVVLPAKATVTVDGGSAFEGKTIACTLSIIHERQQTIETSSAIYHEQPLHIERIAETYPNAKDLFKVQDPDALVVSTYRFTLPAQKKGLYVIDEVSIKVDGIEIRSVPVAYEVIGPELNSSLKLEAKLLENHAIYPGQRVHFQYKITFQDDIELSKEELPLLNLAHFRNIGAPKIDTIQDGQNRVQIILQEAVALQPVHFSSGDSLIEGRSYFISRAGEKIYGKQLLQAVAPGFDITIKAFPKEDMPPSFNGAIGLFYYQVTPLTNPIIVQEKLQIEITVAGQGEMDTLSLDPAWLKEQLQGNFLVSDIPPEATEKNYKKRFIVELRPISQKITTIPSLEFSSFDPALQRYFIVKTKPVAIQVLPNTSKKISPTQITSDKLPTEIMGNVALQSTFNEPSLSTMTALLLMLLFLFLMQKLAFSAYKRRKKNLEGVNSRSLFLQALRQKSHFSKSILLIKQALLMRLFETKEIAQPLLHPEELANHGLQGDIKKFLCSLDERRFSGRLVGRIEMTAIIDQATELYYRMR